MTIETKRISFLPWFAGNVRKMSQGETLKMACDEREGLYAWGIMVLTKDSVLTTHVSPYTITVDGKIDHSRPQTTAGLASNDQINSFGPDNRPWRWRP